MPAFVNRGLMGHSLRIGVTPSVIDLEDAPAVKAALLRDLGPELVQCVERALQEEGIQSLPRISRASGEYTKGNIDAGDQENEQLRTKQGT